MWINLILVFIGGGLGAVSRYGVNIMTLKLWPSSFPYGTLIVNALGSFLIGWFFSLMQKNLSITPLHQAVVVIGFLGGFTTFSAFSWETLALFRSGDFFNGLLNVGLNVLLSLVAVWLGYSLTR